MDDISLRNHVDSLHFHEDMARTKLFIKMLILFEKHATADYTANGNKPVNCASLSTDASWNRGTMRQGNVSG